MTTLNDFIDSLIKWDLHRLYFYSSLDYVKQFVTYLEDKEALVKDSQNLVEV
jgi:hypothetical protein